MFNEDENIKRAVYIAGLISLKREGIPLTEAEESELDQWITEGNKALHDQLLERTNIIGSLKELSEFDDRPRIEYILKQSEVQHAVAPVVRHIHRKVLSTKVWSRIAAILAVVCVITVAYLWINSRSVYTNSNTNLNNRLATNPAKERAILTLNDGHEIILDDAKPGLVASEGATAITKTSGGEIRYSVDDANGAYYATNSIRTPRGGFFRVVLPDSSVAWMNAGSLIRFSPTFSNKRRDLYMEGEVYFDIHENKSSPFYINVNDEVQLKVLGTRFNVKAYGEERKIQTTLLEGSVQVNDTSVLLPGQGTVFDRARHRSTKQLKSDTASAIAWKQGYFHFNGKSLQEALNEVARWYDVEIVYEGQDPDTVLWGEIDRRMSYSKLLDFLKKAGLQVKSSPGKLIILRK